jgi:CheY-like chemotaxis protein
MPATETPPPSPQTQLCKVLVADDEPRIREVCGLLLGKMGCQVTLAASGEEALGLLSPETDIVLTDLHMPGPIGGKDLAVAARAGGRTDVIIMTAFPDTDSAVQAVRTGVSDYLTKPFTADTLRLSLQRCQEKRAFFRDLLEAKNMKADMDRAYEELAWNEKIKGIYGQFTSPEVVKMVLDHPDDFWKRGEERDVTLLLAEVARFSENVESMSPDGKIDTLNKIFNFLTEAIQHEMGHVNRISGEGMLALFGAPVGMVNHAEAAVTAAQRIRNLWKAFTASNKFVEAGGAFGVKIAVHTGRVLTGCLGIKTGTEYGVIGPVVRAAEDLLKTARPGQILLGRESARRTQKTFRVKSLGVYVGAPYPDEVWEVN